MASLVALLTHLIHADIITPAEPQGAVVSSPVAKAFAKYGMARLPHLSFRGLLDVHSRFGLHHRQAAKAALCIRYFS
jgi:hypothetical protein